MQSVFNPFLKQFNVSPLAAVVDIETHAVNNPNAVICSIGCVVINMFTGEHIGSFYDRCNILDQLDYRKADQETLNWWKEQKAQFPKAYAEANDHNLPRQVLPLVLNDLNNFLKRSFNFTTPAIVGNGPEFDNTIIEHAMRQFGIKPVWHFGNNQSLRTIVWLGRALLGVDPKNQPFEGEKHHALDDARHEARCLHVVVKAFADRLAPDLIMDMPFDQLKQLYLDAGLPFPEKDEFARVDLVHQYLGNLKAVPV
ncbi:3'-5' exonuclease [Bowmanella dokdonensis]|uniref:3'-5' exoribonuclease n=1 Tax=Bowmanella dokdonensis TaxID=751969 RepID=A0A939DLH1_9ALTE|nr:3'-5' exonuclease [Bowmanella dokdonensis]MBN7824750.1 3'-5' exoribonuclease [Bowmanella dokdonensis]